MMDPTAAAFDAPHLAPQSPPSDDAASRTEPIANPSLDIQSAHPSPLDVPVPLSMYPPMYPPIGAELDLAYHQRNSSGGTTTSVVTPSVGFPSIARSTPANEPYISSPAGFFHQHPPYSSPGQSMYTQYGHTPAPSPSYNDVPLPSSHMPLRAPPPGAFIYPTFGAALQLFPHPGDSAFFPAAPLQPACPYQQPPFVSHSQPHNYEAMKVGLARVYAEADLIESA